MVLTLIKLMFLVLLLYSTGNEYETIDGQISPAVVILLLIISMKNLKNTKEKYGCL